MEGLVSPGMSGIPQEELSSDGGESGASTVAGLQLSPYSWILCHHCKIPTVGRYTLLVGSLSKSYCSPVDPRVCNELLDVLF